MHKAGDDFDQLTKTSFNLLLERTLHLKEAMENQFRLLVIALMIASCAGNSSKDVSNLSLKDSTNNSVQSPIG